MLRELGAIFKGLKFRGIVVFVLSLLLAIYAARHYQDADLRGRYLEDKLRLALFVGSPRHLLVMHQLELSQHYLEKVSPTEILRKRLHKDSIAAQVQNSSVLDFFYDVYTNKVGVTSSALKYGEGKTISSLSILAKIEQATRNGRDWEGRKVVFLYVNVGDVQGHTITEGLREALHIMDGVNLYKVLGEICTSPGGDQYVIYGLVDQLDMWTEDDQDALRALVQQQSYGLHIHIPSAREDVAIKVNETNGGIKASYEGRVTPSMEHHLTKWQAREFVNALSNNCSIQEGIMHLASKETINGDHPFLNPRKIVEISRLVRKYPGEHSRECAEPRVDTVTLEAG